jgi:HPt (histidine-containing phosphotransfer) domain-containing protein
MDQQECLRAGIDYNDGVARFVGNAGIYEKFLKEFLSDQSFAALETALDGGDLSASFQAAHTLKGLTGNLSLNVLYGHLVTLTDALRGAGNLPLAQSLFPTVREDYRRAVDFIRANVK